MAEATKAKKEEATKLAARIEELNLAYYQNDEPLVTDSEYDQLFRSLQELEEKYPELRTLDSPTRRVGAAPASKFKKYTHATPMLSLQNAMNREELNAFTERVYKLAESTTLAFHSEVKFDGLSVNLRYEQGVLVSAATRGNGAIGEEVSNNIRTIRNIPLRLSGADYPDFIEIRGEVVLPIQEFQDLNERRKNQGLDLFANTRNAAAGSVRQLDSAVTADRRLKMFAYGIGGHGDWLEPESQELLLDQLMRWGFEDFQLHRVCQTPDDIWSFFQEIDAKREGLPFDIDGVVVKVNSRELQDSLGSIARAPRSMVAIKFPPRQEKTKLKSISIQVGRTGVLSPVAELEPVNIHGVVVSRATLHNKDEIQRKGVLIGDTVLVQRAGDVIPEVIRSVPELRTGKEVAFEFPATCPSCETPVSQNEDEAAIRCLNPRCPAQFFERLKHFVSKNAMDIVGLGPRILQQLIEKKMVTSLIDLYGLKEAQLAELEGFKEKSVSNLLKAIEASKSKPLHAFVFALGIRHVGEQTARALATRYPDISGIFSATTDELIEIDDVGNTVAESIVSFFADKANQQDVLALRKLGLAETREVQRVESHLAGMTVVITGTLPTLGRKDAADLVRNNGGKVSSSVSKKTTYLLCGESPGSKLKKAQELGVEVLNEETFLRLVQLSN